MGIKSGDNNLSKLCCALFPSSSSSSSTSGYIERHTKDLPPPAPFAIPPSSATISTTYHIYTHYHPSVHKITQSILHDKHQLTNQPFPFTDLVTPFFFPPLLTTSSLLVPSFLPPSLLPLYLSPPSSNNTPPHPNPPPPTSPNTILYSHLTYPS